MPYLNMAVGFNSTRTAGKVAPPMDTWPMPSSCDSRCCSTLLAASYNWPRVRVCDVNARIMSGASAGFTFRYDGLLDRLVDTSAAAALMAASTSRAAPLMSRFKSNCRVMRVWPEVLLEVISVTSAIWPRKRSNGSATLVDTVSGSAPGSEADTEMVG